ncbi:MAG: subtilisin family serine protease [Cognaticolwellia sp.]|jgi:subtilisin family serine protease
MKNSLLIIVFLCLSIISNAQDYIKHEVIVMLSQNTSWEDFEGKLNSMEFKSLIFQEFQSREFNSMQNDWFTISKDLSEVLNIGLLRFDKVLDESIILKALFQLSEVQTVQLNYLAEYRGIPNDEFYTRQENMDIISASDAWEFTTGGLSPNGDTIVVFVIDNGIDLNHEDLSENIWVNYGEIPNNGIDDDNNNYVDDYTGWHFEDESDNHPPSLHGGAVSGIIGAKGNNNIGVTGINWDVKILPYTILLRSNLSAINVINAYAYALYMRQRYDDSGGSEGAYIVATNFSAGFANKFPNEFPILCEVYNMLGESGILSVSAVTNDESINVQATGDIPTLCSSPYLITVTETDMTDKRLGGYGIVAVDLAAPGVGSYSTYPISNYDYFSGTSCSTPHVTGSIALLYSLDSRLFGEAIKNEPAESALFIKSMLLNGTDKIDSLRFSTLTSGRLNIGNSMNLLSNYYGGWSESFKFVNVHPNPVNDLLTVVYQTPQIGDFYILLYNSVGQLLLQTQKKVAEVGFKSFELDVSNMEAGVYFLLLKNNEDSLIKKIVVY